MAKLETRIILSINDLIEDVRPSQDETIGRVYRGHRNGNWKLVPPLYRISHLPILQGNWKSLWERLFREFKRRARPYVKEELSEFDWLVLARHHGLPTPVLDWTTNPLVALWFALYPHSEEASDSVVWKLGTSKTTISSGTIPKTDPEDNFGKLIVPHVSSRVVGQSSIFTLHGHPSASNPFIPIEDRWDKKAQDEADRNIGWFTLTKFVVPKKIKLELLAKLGCLDISPSAIYPDLDGVTREVKFRIEQALIIEGKTIPIW